MTDKEADAITTPPAAPVQEPVAWHHQDCEGECVVCLIEREVQRAYGNQGLAYLRRHVTTPPAAQRPWVGLTDDDYNTDMFAITSLGACDIATIKSIAKDVEAKLKEKNT